MGFFVLKMSKGITSATLGTLFLKETLIKTVFSSFNFNQLMFSSKINELKKINKSWMGVLSRENSAVFC